jgi:hypothetical protein
MMKPYAVLLDKGALSTPKTMDYRYSSNTGNTNTPCHPSKDSKGNPLCYKCGKFGYSFQCPDHPKRARFYALGVDEEEPRQIPESDDQDEGKEPSGDIPEDLEAEDGKVEDCFIEDPYEPTDPLNKREREPEDEVAFGYIG